MLRQAAGSAASDCLRQQMGDRGGGVSVVMSPSTRVTMGGRRYHLQDGLGQELSVRLQHLGQQRHVLPPGQQLRLQG